MADHLHPAIDIPGGLWRGAIVEVHSIGMTLTIVSMAGGGAYVEGHRGPWDLADLSLRLDDPDGMGLGLAGLAARVAERAGIGWSVTDGMEALEPHLARARWTPAHWFTLPKWAPAYRLAVAYADVIREAATLLARLDRLVAATWPDDGIVLAPGTVPDWRRDGAEWVLTVGPVGCARYAVDVLDPIEAAGAALEVRGG